MAENVELGPDARSLVERLRNVCLGHFERDRDRAERAVTEHVRALGEPPRPVRWPDDAADGFLAAWRDGLFLVGSKVERGNNALVALGEAVTSGEAELKRLEKASKSAADRAKAAAMQATEICSKWHSDIASERAAFALGQWSRELDVGKRAGAWVEDKIARYSLGGMWTPFMGETKEVTAARQAGFGMAMPDAARAVLWAAQAHAVRETGAACPALDRLVELYRPLVDAVEAGVWLLWVVDDEIVAVEAPKRPEPKRDASTGEWKPDPVVQQLFREKLARLDRWAVEEAAKALPKYLKPDERVVTMAAAYVDGKQGLLTATSRRLLFVRSSALGGKGPREFPYESLSVAEETGTTIRIVGAYDSCALRIDDPDRRAEVLAVIEERMPAQAPGTAEAPAKPAERRAEQRAEIERLTHEPLARKVAKDALRSLPGHLEPDEHVLTLVGATMGLLALTDRRAVYLHVTVRGRDELTEIPYASVTHVGTDLGRLSIFSPAEKLSLDVRPKESLAEVATAVQERLAEVGVVTEHDRTEQIAAIEELARLPLARKVPQLALTTLPHHLAPDEEVSILVGADYGGALALTDRRVIHHVWSAGATGGIVEIPYESLTQVHTERGRLRIGSGTLELDLNIRPKDALDEIAAALRQRMPEPAAEVAAPPDAETQGEGDSEAVDRSRLETAIAELVAKLRRMDRWAVEQAAKSLPTYLHDQEEPLALASVLLDGKLGLLVATGERLLFLPTARDSLRSDTLEISYSSLTSFEFQWDLHLATAARAYVFSGDIRRTGEIAAVIRERMPEPAVEHDLA